MYIYNIYLLYYNILYYHGLLNTWPTVFSKPWYYILLYIIYIIQRLIKEKNKLIKEKKLNTS